MKPQAAIYARVSTRQQEQAATIASQIEAVLSYAAQAGYEVPEKHQYIDQAVSGSEIQRRGLNRLRDAVAAGEVDVLVCMAPDRLARNLGVEVVLMQ